METVQVAKANHRSAMGREGVILGLSHQIKSLPKSLASQAKKIIAHLEEQQSEYYASDEYDGYSPLMLRVDSQRMQAREYKRGLEAALEIAKKTEAFGRAGYVVIDLKERIAELA